MDIDGGGGGYSSYNGSTSFSFADTKTHSCYVNLYYKKNNDWILVSNSGNLNDYMGNYGYRMVYDTNNSSHSEPIHQFNITAQEWKMEMIGWANSLTKIKDFTICGFCFDQ